ncbi:MAG: ParB/RepB/Spo0J family partition protein [Bacteroidales bacterium]|nr:ParB/RepB/Spo0J family partition protein [Bacteroidales bacterium]
MAKRNALGKGLGALIEDAGNDNHYQVDAVNEISLDLIEVNPYQPRTSFDEGALQELASSIKEIGVIQPITVRQIDDTQFQLITGERRFRAARMAGINKIPAFIRTADDQAMLEMALVENIQREDLDAIEVAISYQRLIEECELTQENLSGRVGKKRATISNYLRLLKLPAEIQLGIRDHKISMGHARALINIEDPDKQLQAYYRILDEGLSVRATEDMIRNLGQTQPGKKSSTSTRKTLPEEYQQLKHSLADHFNTNIDVKRNDNGKGKIVIPFKSDKDLERIMSIINQGKEE